MAIPERVLLTADSVGGVWTYAIELARGLSERGTRIALATMGAPLSRGQGREASCVRGLQVFETGFKLEWMPDPWEDVRRAGDWLLALTASFQPDLVHLNQYAFGSLPFGCPALVAGHSCVLSWWRAVRGGEPPPEWSRYRDAVASGLCAADLVVAPTQAMLTALERHYGTLHRSTVIPNGRTVPKRKAAAKQSFVFAAGRLWDEAKNLAALEQVATDLPWPVYVAGELHHPAGSAGRCSACRPLGKLSARQVGLWMERAAIYALPARYEPFGLSALEAALRGCALILGDIPSLREVWEDTAIFVPPDDRDALRDAALRLIASPELRSRFAARARSRALTFSASRMVDSYLRAYCAVLGCETAVRHA